MTHDIDVFDWHILSVLRDGKAKYFEHVLSEAALSPNTLRHHLDQLLDQDLIEREVKWPGLGLVVLDSSTACPETSMDGPFWIPIRACGPVL